MGQGLSRNGARPAYLSPQRSDAAIAAAAWRLPTANSFRASAHRSVQRATARLLTPAHLTFAKIRRAEAASEQSEGAPGAHITSW